MEEIFRKELKSVLSSGLSWRLNIGTSCNNYGNVVIVPCNLRDQIQG